MIDLKDFKLNRLDRPSNSSTRKNCDLLNFPTEKVRDIPGWNEEVKPYASAGFKRHTTSGESHLLFTIPRELGPGNYADLGTLLGGSTVTIGHGLNLLDNRSVLYSVDLFDEFWETNRNVAKTVPDKLTNYFNSVLTNVEFNLCREDTSTVGNSLNIPFKFVFIDADHTYEGCKKDFVAWERLIELGGCIAFHDCNTEGVAQVLDEIDNSKWQLINHIYSIKLFKRIK